MFYMPRIEMIIKNVGDKSIYLPNLADLYWDFPIIIFLVNPKNNEQISDSEVSGIGVLSIDSWIRIGAKESIELNKKVRIYDENSESWNLKNYIRERSDDISFGVDDRKKIAKYKMFAKIIYNKPDYKAEQGWLIDAGLKSDQVEFWRGEVESNKLNLGDILQTKPTSPPAKPSPRPHGHSL